jgi:hypothetical protein
MAQTISLEAKGLFTHRNPLTAPPGALEICDNVVIDKENVISNRRGFKTFGDEITGLGDAESINRLFEYKDRPLIHYHQTLAYDSDGAGSWVDYAGNYSPPAGESKIRAAEANRNFYFTSSAGIKKLDKLTGTIKDSGIPKALGASGSITGSSGFFTINNQVCYRVVWAIEDENKNLVLGAPSERLVVTNSTGTKVVDLTFPVPSEVDSTKYFYQVYRSGLSGGVGVEPNDELQLVIEKYITSAQITALSVSITDETPNSLMGATLYTCPSQQGISQSNNRAPLAKDLTTFKNHVFYMNTVGKYRFNLTTISVGSPNLNYYDVTGDPQAAGTTITNISLTIGLAVGQLVTWSGQPSNPAKVTQIDSSTVTIDQTIGSGSTGTSIRFHDRLSVGSLDFYAHSSAQTASSSPYTFIADTSSDLASNIDITTRSLIDVVNKASGNSLVYAYYLSGYDDLPGKILFEERGLGGSSFALTSSKGGTFSPALAESGTDDQSTNDTGLNRIYISKTSLPEAVPTLNYIDVGSADKAIQRGIALRDSVFIFKQDGLYRLTGESVSNFAITLFDNTVRLIGEETAVPFNNSVFCYSNQGVIAVSDAGVTVMSRPIEADILKLSSDNYTNFKTASWGLAYESDRKYFLFTVSGTLDTVAQTAYCYNSFTNTWTKWDMVRSAGLVLSSDDKMYLSSGDIPAKKYIYQERKSFDIFDYSDEEFPVVITSIDEKEVTVSDASSVVVGYTLAQSSSKKSKVVSILGNVLTLSDIKSWASGAAKVYQPYSTRVKWSPIHGGNPGVLKQFSELSMFFQDAEFDSIDLLFSTNLSLTQVKTSISPVRGSSWGNFNWGRTLFGGGAPEVQPIRTLVPLESQRAHWLDLRVEHGQALDQFSLSGFSVIIDGMSSRFR